MKVFLTYKPDLNEYIYKYNHERTNQGKRCNGNTPYQTFLDGIKVFEEKVI